MQIKKIHISNFGKLHEMQMDFSEGLNVINGENGWGKSTLAAFLKAMLYGMDVTTKRSLLENERRRYKPWQGGAYGGGMEFEANGKSYRMERFFGTKEREDKFALYDLATGLPSTDYSEHLGDELFHIDRAAWERTCYLGQLNLGVAVNDSLNARLTHVEEESGDMQNYEQAVRLLEDRMKYFRKTGNRGQIAKLRDDQRAVREDQMILMNRMKELENERTAHIEQKRQEQFAHEKTEQLEKTGRKLQERNIQKNEQEQYLQLKQRADATEAVLQKANVALAQYETVPADETLLDLLRSQIYELRTTIEKREAAAQQKERSEASVRSQQEVLEECQELVAGRKQGLAGAFGTAAAGAVFVLLSKTVANAEIFSSEKASMLAGAATLVFGALLIIGSFLKALRETGKWGKQGRELHKVKVALENYEEQAEQDAEVYEELDRTMKELRHRLTETFQTSEDATPEELEACWQQERKRSQEYQQLKAECESRRNASRDAKEICQSYLNDHPKAAEPLPEMEFISQEELERRLQQNREAEKAIQQETGRIESRIRMLEEETVRLPELEEQDAALTAQIEDAVRTCDRLEQTLGFLETAKNQLLSRYLDRLKEGTEDYLSELVPEWEPSVAMDVNLKMKVQQEGSLRDTECFSTGWQDLFRLAERFALVDAICDADQPTVVLDDPFVNLDPKKYKNARKILEKLGEKRQLIYFSCRE